MREVSSNYCTRFYQQLLERRYELTVKENESNVLIILLSYFLAER